MNEIRMAVKAVNLALGTVKFANVVKRTAIAFIIAVCGYAFYRGFHEQ